MSNVTIHPSKIYSFENTNEYTDHRCVAPHLSLFAPGIIFKCVMCLQSEVKTVMLR